MINKAYSTKKAVCKLSFSLSSDQVGKQAEVLVLGQFNNWNQDQALVLKAKKNTYEGSIELTTGTSYEFRYLVNGQEWFNDEAADDYVPTPFFSHNSVATLEVKEISQPSKKEKPARKAAPKKAKVAKKTTKVVADNLKKIEGIGPKIAGLLKAEGVVTFEDLGKAKLAKLKAVLAAAGPRYKMHQPNTWAKQAKLAAKGKWEELTKLQDELKGGIAK